ncbi:MAG: 16S rRNA (cytidine(1402)-2'-O)-methyltransferase [Clostridium sp.]|nr:16S rRNA (cytidine(1402)-2'-O)-methyltransferase [Clostridium sp.]
MSKLYIVPTPIGNLGDITLRSLETLKEVDLIACEDTRVTSKLLNYYKIKKPLINYREHNEREVSDIIIDKIKNGESVALVSDAGMPGISDPGEILIKKCIEKDILVSVLPGASALINALVSSGLDTRRFTFIGFLDKNKNKKRKELEMYKDRQETIIIYESPHRIVDTLKAINEIFKDRSISVSREISKLYEENIRGTANDVLKYLSESKIRGEFVLVISGKSIEEINAEIKESYENLTIKDHIIKEMAKGISKKEAINEVAKIRSIPKKEVYSESIDI